MKFNYRLELSFNVPSVAQIQGQPQVHFRAALSPFVTELLPASDPGSIPSSGNGQLLGTQQAMGAWSQGFGVSVFSKSPSVFNPSLVGLLVSKAHLSVRLRQVQQVSIPSPNVDAISALIHAIEPVFNTTLPGGSITNSPLMERVDITSTPFSRFSKYTPSSISQLPICSYGIGLVPWMLENVVFAALPGSRFSLELLLSVECTLDSAFTAASQFPSEAGLMLSGGDVNVQMVTTSVGSTDYPVTTITEWTPAYVYQTLNANNSTQVPNITSTSRIYLQDSASTSVGLVSCRQAFSTQWDPIVGEWI